MEVATPEAFDNRRGIDTARAWLMAGVAFVACFVIFGVVYSFGAFFKPLGTEFGAGRADTSAIFAITGAIYGTLGFFGGRFTDRFGPRRVMLIGAVAFACGLVLTAHAATLRSAYVVYGIGVGIGVGCTYVPVLAIVGGWFERYRNTAMGIAVAGIGAGTLAVAPLAADLIQHFGWREAYVLMGVASGILLLACAFLAQAPPIIASAEPPRISRQARTPEFAMLYMAALLASVPIYVPFVYLPDFAQTRGVTEIAAAALVGFVGAASLVGRLSFGAIANRVGILWLYKVSLLVLAVSYAFWPIAHSYSMLVLFAIVMGSAYGGMVSLSPTVVAELFGIEGLGTTLGALYTSSGISALAGPPLVGYVIDHSGSYLWGAAIAGGAGLLAYLFLLPLQAHPVSEVSSPPVRGLVSNK